MRVTNNIVSHKISKTQQRFFVYISSKSNIGWSMETQPSIYSYFNYREYLQEWFCWKKVQSSHYSHRVFSRTAGLSSPNYLNRVLSGSRNLSFDYIKNFVDAIGLSRAEESYLTLMVHYEQAANSTEKALWLKKMMSRRTMRGMQQLTDDRLRFFEKWYYPIIRELVCFTENPDDLAAIGKQCIPPISDAEVGSAISFLSDNGFILREENGGYKQCDPGITSGDEVNSVFVRAYNQQILRQTVDLVDTVSKTDREVSSATLGVSLETFGKMREEIRQFRKRLIDMALADSGTELVCIASLQLMPRSTTRISEKAENVSQ